MLCFAAIGFLHRSLDEAHEFTICLTPVSTSPSIGMLLSPMAGRRLRGGSSSMPTTVSWESIYKSNVSLKLHYFQISAKFEGVLSTFEPVDAGAERK